MWSPSVLDLSRPASGLIIVALVITGLYVGRDILIPLTLAAFLSFLLTPLVRRLVDLGVPRPVVSIGGVFVVLLILVGGTMFLAQQIASFADELPKYEMTIRDKVRSLTEAMRGTGSWRHASELLQRVTEDVVGAPQGEAAAPSEKRSEPSSFSAVFDFARSTIPTFATLGLALLFTIFMLLQYHEIRDRFVRVMGSHEIGRSTQALSAAAVDLGQFFLLQVSLNASFGVVIGVMMWLIGIPNPAVWGLLAGLMRFVPYVGSLIAALLPIMVAAAVDPGWWKLAATAATFIVADLTVGNFVEPLLFGRKTRLSPFAVLFAVVFWTSIWGPMGLILAVPLTLALVVFGEHVPPLSPLALLLGNTPALKPHERLYHLLSAGDVSQAVREAEQYLADNTVEHYVDNVAIPAFNLGADDYRRGVLESVHLTKLEGDVAEFITMLKELIDLRYDELAAEGDYVPDSDAERIGVHFIPGRGLFDQAAARVVAAVARREIPIDESVSSVGGLTAFGEIVARPEDERPQMIALISAGGLTSSQVALLVRRAQRDVPGIKLLLGWFGSSRDEGAAIFKHTQSAFSGSSLIDAAGLLIKEGRAPAATTSTVPGKLFGGPAPGEQAPEHSDAIPRPERQVLVAD
jgi:predicted PurR-regulated permease PerM